MTRTRLFAALCAAAVLAPIALAHDDDPKLWARELPYRGPGWSAPLDLFGRPVVPGGQGAGGATQASSSACGPFACTPGVRLLSWTPLDAFAGATAANDCWGYVSPTGREYALIGLSNGTAVVEVTVPSAPVVVAHVRGPSSTWRDVKTYGQWAYAVSEGGGGIQAFDLTDVDLGIVKPAGSYSRFRSHNAYVDEATGYLYRAGGGRNGLHVYDLNANPANPPLVGAWNVQYVHDVVVRTFTSGPAAGKQVAFCSSGDDGTLHTLDVTDKKNIVHMDEIAWPNAAFAHQAWLSDDGRYAYVNDEFDEPGLRTTTYVVDVLDPSNMVYLGAFTNGNSAVGHNGFVRGDLLFEANYRSGLRVFDTAQDPLNPPEIAWFDTYPSDDAPVFNGLWGCYPFLPSGIVVGSDTVRGLFVWWVGPPQVDIAYPAGQPAKINADGDAVRVRLTPEDAVAQGTPMLHYDAGQGWVGVPLQSQGPVAGGDQWNAVFPALPCGATVSWYVSVASTGNITWTSPSDAPAAVWTTTTHCPATPFSYCVAKENSCGGTPALKFNGVPSATAAGGFAVRTGGARSGKIGLVLYTDQGPGSSPLSGGTLCVSHQNLRRTPVFTAAGGSPGNCDAAFAFDMNAFAAGNLGGSPKPFLSTPGTRVNVQIWGRDTFATSFLSDGGQYVVGP